MKTKLHWLLSIAMLCLLGWQVRHLLSQPALNNSYSAFASGNAGVYQPWYAQTDVVIALLAASLFVTLMLAPSRQTR